MSTQDENLTFPITISKLEKEALIFALKTAQNEATRGEQMWGALVSYRADIKCFSDLLNKLENLGAE